MRALINPSEDNASMTCCLVTHDESESQAFSKYSKLWYEQCGPKLTHIAESSTRFCGVLKDMMTSFMLKIEPVGLPNDIFKSLISNNKWYGNVSILS